jgi:hypothetical protein
MHCTNRSRLILVVMFVIALSDAHADDHPMLDYLSVSVGGFANNNAASIRADGGVKDSGTRLDFDRDLGQGGTRTLPYVDVTWRPWDRHEFEFSYYYDAHDSSRYVSRDISFNGNDFLLGGQLKSRFTLSTGALNYRYWAWIGDRGAFGVWAGLQAYRFSLRLSGDVTVQNGSTSGQASATRSASVSTALPDPSLGVSYRYQAADWARLVVDAGAFKANVDNIDATLYSARLGAEFYPWQHFGVITQYTFNKIDADVTKNKFNGNLDFKFRGFQLLLKVRF